MGLSESANVALVIFLAHLATLLVLAVFCVIYLVQDWSLFVVRIDYISMVAYANCDIIAKLEHWYGY